jgi:3-hydroxyisobutyrate dehydrogenase
MALRHRTVGGIGTGRLGVALAARLPRAGYDLAVWNRTRAKAEPLEQSGARIVGSAADLGGCDVVVTMVANSEVFEQVPIGEGGLLTAERAPRFLIDSSTVSAEASQRGRTAADKRGCTHRGRVVAGMSVYGSCAGSDRGEGPCSAPRLVAAAGLLSFS